MHIIFDLDDTLIECSPHYIDVTERVNDYQVHRTGLPKALVEKIMHGIDLAMATTLPDAFSRSRFPTAAVATSYALDAIAQLPPTQLAAAHAFELVDSVFDAEYPLITGAKTTLKELKAMGWSLYLYSKGDEAVQHRKITKNGLAEFFDVIHITPAKTGMLMQQFCTKYHIPIAQPHNTWIIGDSRRDDIGVANSLGIHSVLMTNVKHSWGYEISDENGPVPTRTAYRLSQLYAIMYEAAHLSRSVVNA